jgi:C1A family cysteine protease
MPVPAAPPITYDWRNTPNAISPPHNQQNCDSCSSFAVAAAIGARLSIAAHQIVEISSGYFHTCLGNPDKTDPQQICDGQVNLYTMVQQVVNNGYVLMTPGDYPFPQAACDTAAIAGQISAMTPIANAMDAKIELVNHGPIVADMYIWPDFFTYTAARSSTYVPDMTQGNSEVHAVCVIGYNAQGWIIKNSMGPAWGDGRGFAIIAYGDCMLIEGPNNPQGGLAGLPARETFALQI